jgi:hypothetical protein
VQLSFAVLRQLQTLNLKSCKHADIDLDQSSLARHKRATRTTVASSGLAASDADLRHVTHVTVTGAIAP